jgi:leucyl/phenylalanyl-tRNA--protein transferase
VRPLSPDERTTVDALLSLYRQGAFPMADPETGEVCFCTTRIRGVVPLTGPRAARPARRLVRTLRSGRFAFTSDEAFEAVIRACAEPRPDEPTSWINEQIVQWCLLLHDAGCAHSVEAWRTDPGTGERVLVGGLYGVTLGGAFFGESMFHRARPRRPDGSRHPLDGADASKACFALVCEHLRARGFPLFDVQFLNDHTERLGGVDVSQARYLHTLMEAVEEQPAWRPFEPDLLVARLGAGQG